MLRRRLCPELGYQVLEKRNPRRLRHGRAVQYIVAEDKRCPALASSETAARKAVGTDLAFTNLEFPRFGAFQNPWFSIDYDDG
jgi:hypothetical protein